MALATMESIRCAEQDAENKIQETIRTAQQAVSDAKRSYEEIIFNAKQDADTTLAHSKNKASAVAEEIIVTARNNALLAADKLKNECKNKQDAVNKAILELII